MKHRTTKFTGLAAWWVQRASAVYLLGFAILALAALLLHAPRSHAEWKAWLVHPAISVAVLGFFAALLLHAWVGLRDVLLDYARPAGLRRFLLVAVAVGLPAIGLWVTWVLLRARGG